MEQRKIQKTKKCKFCTRVINKKLIPINDTVKLRGVAYYKGKLVHSKCFRQVAGQEEYKEGAVKSNYKLENMELQREAYFR